VRMGWCWRAAKPAAVTPANARMRVGGHLFQGRFGSVVMDEPHPIAAARYVALNPVRAGVVRRARNWPWSSVRAHLQGRNDGFGVVAPLIERTAGRFADLIATEATPEDLAAIRTAEIATHQAPPTRPRRWTGVREPLGQWARTRATRRGGAAMVFGRAVV
jgi:hypothetical protein